ncbi:hypothetical protein [Shewanella algae]|uniref:hypothetical protein n=1 Tax=Shewanella algae TaxID=38313 RepID=UPI001BED93FB|nr:hypothetical protein [Shewanella algae]MCE9783441.1 hypothetical protein [Shewanella algae]BCV33567.1 hypothetical protein TUM4442_30940 [Shewanella algae]
MTKSPYKDRKLLLKDISSFTTRNGAFFKQNAKRMSDLFEMSVYNDAVKYYRRKKYTISINNLMRDGTFKYKLTPAGLSENFSYFVATKKNNKQPDDVVEIHHNIKVQSHHDPHIYFTADVSVTNEDGVTTQNQKNRKSHSFIPSDALLTFFEVKNMNPFPEVLFSFTGILYEVKPEFVLNSSALGISTGKKHLTPSLVFSGSGGAHVESVADKLGQRYGCNIIRGLYANKGKIYSYDKLRSYDA